MLRLTCLNQHIIWRTSSQKECASGLLQHDTTSCLPERTGLFHLSPQIWLVITHSYKTQPQLFSDSQSRPCSHGNHFGGLTLLSHNLLLLCLDTGETSTGSPTSFTDSRSPMTFKDSQGLSFHSCSVCVIKWHLLITAEDLGLNGPGSLS